MHCQWVLFDPETVVPFAEIDIVKSPFWYSSTWGFIRLSYLKSQSRTSLKKFLLLRIELGWLD